MTGTDDVIVPLLLCDVSASESVVVCDDNADVGAFEAVLDDDDDDDASGNDE